MEAVLWIHAAATWFMVGVIWFVQLVHYPLFCRVERSAFGAYAKENVRRTSRTLGGVMVAEAITAVLLVLWPPPGIGRAWPIAGLAALALIWLSRLLQELPAHFRMIRDGFLDDLHRALCRWNWLSTVLWTARGALALWFLRPQG